MKLLTLETPAPGIIKLSLNRPEKGNALSNELIAELTEQLKKTNDDANTRAVILTGNGKHFCTGADLNDMQAMIDASEADNLKQATQIATLMQTLYACNKPIIALAQGATFGGGLGLLACCDIVIAENNASFCFSEVKIGLAPAVIAPFVIQAIGMRQAKRYLLTAEKFDANTAKSIGLAHQITDQQNLHEAGLTIANQLAQNCPQAVAKTKALLNQLQPVDDHAIELTTKLLAKIRVSKQGQKGIKAFFDKSV